MMSVEKNTDLVKMASYAPLLENVNKRDWEVNMIHFDSSRVFARATYHAQKLFAENLPSVNLPAAVTLDGRRRSRWRAASASAPGIRRRSSRTSRVERDGAVVYQSDFTRRGSGLGARHGPGSGRTRHTGAPSTAPTGRAAKSSRSRMPAMRAGPT